MASTYLYRSTDATASSGYSSTWTWSGWVKRSSLSGEQGIFMNKKDSDNTASRFRMSFGSGGNLLWECKDSSNSDDNSFVTNMLFRDTNAWYHIVFSYDTTQGTEANRLKLWVNGVDIRNDGGGFSSINEASSNFGTLWSSASKHFVGRTSNNSGTAHIFDGLMSHVHLTYGTTYTASTFGSTDSTTGEWKINTDPNVTYGSQGYFMLKDNASVTDQSGEGNNFTASGTLTKTEDNPSNVFCTWNPLSKHPSCGHTYAWGNNKITMTTSRGSTAGTLGIPNNKGKFYWEIKVATQAQDGRLELGLQPFSNVEANDSTNANNKGLGLNGYNGYIYYSGSSLNNFYNTVGGFTSFTGIIGIAVDLTSATKTMAMSRDGAWITGQNATSTDFSNALKVDITSSVDNYSHWLPMAGSGNGSGTGGVIETNFGNGYFADNAVSSAGTNASGNGIFEYDVPTGYTALSTKGLNL